MEHSLIALNIALLIQLIGMLIMSHIDPYIEKRHKRLLIITALVVVSLLIQEWLEYYFLSDISMVYPRTVCAVYENIARPVTIVLFMQMLIKDRRPWVLVIINALIYSTAFFSDIVFSFGEDYTMKRGPLGMTCQIVCTILVVWQAAQVIYTFRRGQKAGSIVHMIVVIFMIMASVMDSFEGRDSNVSYMTVSIVEGCMFFYIWLHLLYVREYEKVLIDQQHLRLMITQMQPHFVFNTITTIQALCRIDPQKAADTAEKFGTYLRQNIDSINRVGLIPFDEELEHTKVYAQIEMTRFPNITIEYDIRDNDFELPALSLQPMVENAIRHGVRIREHGLVKVSTYRANEGHYLVIYDNGKGFDVREAQRSDSSHIGIRNVKERLFKMCDGSMTIQSVIGESTTVTIVIP